MDSKSKVLDYITTDMTPEFFIKPGDQALSRLLLFQFSSKWHQIWMHNIVEVLVKRSKRDL